jgi:hypothetical protein
MTTTWGKLGPEPRSEPLARTFHYLLAVACGAFAGWIDIKIGDLLFTALLVLASCMLLGILRPQKPWRWVVLVGLFVPVADLLAYLLMAQKPYRVQIYESLLAFLPAIAGAYGGSAMRAAIDNLISK